MSSWDFGDKSGAPAGRPATEDAQAGGGVAFPFAPAASAPILVPGLGGGEAAKPVMDEDSVFGPPTGGTAAGFAPAAASDALADHFLACCRLGRYLTVAQGNRFVITDDFRASPAQAPADAAAMAAIYSRDFLVAESALLPLGRTAGRLEGAERAKFERLFDLIEAHALAPAVKSSAHAMLERDFSLIDLRAIEGDLDLRLSPARTRYREFLAIVARLIQGDVAARDFVQEFVDFTRTVAGRLDFGIYSFCIDRIFGSPRVPEGVKRVLAVEIIKYPPLVRRELVTNILTLPGQPPELVAFVRRLLNDRLERAHLIEIELLEAVKASRLTMGEIETRLRREIRPA
ncbi:MAG: hypothetical protein EXR02_00145 [Rhodospirillales bacterium]|nr:hypothetical protein [Rhodospirillales bacterium]MSP79468.1 hypothetical protein [Rhodospirillales bacterium]